MEDEKIANKRKKIAERIAGDGTTTLGQSRTDMVSERITNDMTFKQSERTTSKLEPRTPIVRLPANQKSTTPLDHTFQINSPDDMNPKGEINALAEIRMQRTFSQTKGPVSQLLLAS